MLKRSIIVYHHLSQKNSNRDLIISPKISNRKTVIEEVLPHESYLPMYQLFVYTIEAIENLYQGSILKILNYLKRALEEQGNDKCGQLFPLKENVLASLLNSNVSIKSNDILGNTLKPVPDLSDISTLKERFQSVGISKSAITLLSGLSEYIMEDIPGNINQVDVKILFIVDMQTPDTQVLIADLLSRHCIKNIDITNELVSILEKNCYFSVFKSFNSSNKGHISLNRMEEVLLVLQKNILNDGNRAQDFISKKKYYSYLKNCKNADIMIKDLILNLGCDLQFDNVEDLSRLLNQYLKDVYSVETEPILM